MLKCVIWDLDDTIWKGTLKNEDELILLSSAYKLIKEIDAAGIMQSIISRNNYTDAMQQLKIFNLDKYFLYPQINSLSKVHNMKKIIKLMNINVDSVVFIDDNEFETSQINYFFPQVITANNTEELELIVRNQLENYVGKTYENYNRRELMLNRMKRQEEQNNFKGTNEQFLASCEMSLTIRRAKENDILRIEELAVRTNQLNNFKKKVNVCTIQEYLILEDRALYVCELEDRFGNHGIVGSCFIRIDGDKAIVKQFCISCRIEGRGIGYSFLSHVIHNIQQRYSDITMIICDFCVSSKNSSALYLLKALGFKYLNEKENYSVYSVKIPHKYSKVNWLKVINMEEI